MAKTQVRFDEAGDFLEMTFANRKGSFHEIGPDLYARVDANGQVIGFAIFNFLKRARKNVELPIELAAVGAVSGSR